MSKALTARTDGEEGYTELELGARGLAVVDFGAGGALDAYVAISGQTAITAAHVPMAQVACVATADHSADEHMIEELEVRCGPVLPGSGFLVLARTRNTRLFGRYSISWSWG